MVAIDVQRIIKRFGAFTAVNGISFELEAGKVLGSMWDLGGQGHPMISSMREHKGFLYLGGVSNNRIGRIALKDADKGFVAHRAWWGKS